MPPWKNLFSTQTSCTFANPLQCQWVNSCTPVTRNCFQAILMIVLFQPAPLMLAPHDYPLLTTCFCLELTYLQGSDPSGVASLKNFCRQYLEFKRATVFCLGHHLSKNKWQDMLETLGGPWPLATPINVPSHLLLRKCGLQHQSPYNSFATFTFKSQYMKHVLNEQN